MAWPRSLVLALAVLVASGKQAYAQIQHPLHFLAKQCNEDAVGVRVDPRQFQELAGSGFSPVLEEGKARVLIVVHDCGEYWLDGEKMGPTQETQVWLAIQGLDDIRPVVGAERTLPTRTWLSLFSGSSNPRVRELKTASGTVQLPIRGISLDPPGPRRGGRLLLPGDLEYAWQVVSTAPAARLVGINHDVYTRDSAGNVALNRIQVIVHVSAGPSAGMLTVVGRTDPVPWIGPGTYPVVVQTFFPMWSRATLGLQPSGRSSAK